MGNGNLVLVRVQSCAPVLLLCSADGGVATGLVVPMTTSSLGSLPSTPQSSKTTSTFNGCCSCLVRVRSCAPVLLLRSADVGVYGTRGPDMSTSSLGSLPSTLQSSKTTNTFNGCCSCLVRVRSCAPRSLKELPGVSFLCYCAAMSKRAFEKFFRKQWERLGFGPARPPRVAGGDGEDDGLASSRVPRNPVETRLSGGATVGTLEREGGEGER